MTANCGVIFLVWLGVMLVMGIFNLLKKFFGSDGPQDGQGRPRSETSSPSRGSPSRNEFQEIAKAVSSGLTVGVYCALGDGHMDSRELKLIQELKDSLLEAAPADARAQLRPLMDQELETSLRGVSEDRLHQACRSHSHLPEHFKGMTMQLAFKVVAADGRVDDREMACLRRVAGLLAISDETFQRLESQHLEPIRIKDLTNDNADVDKRWKALGIDPTWSKDRKLAKLNDEFQKYNARMSSLSDQTKRMECKRMLEIIAELRDELQNGPKPKPKPVPKPTPAPRTTEPKPNGPPASRDEVLVGIDPSLSPSEKLKLLDKEEARWKARQELQIAPAAKAKCDAALIAIGRLRNLYRTQL
jgi:uncharacterized tellurite resistance protein B-like protein